MNTSAAEIRVFNNVLSGKVRIISANGRVVSSMDGMESDDPSYQRLKNSLLLLKLIERAKRRQDILITAKKNIIQIQIDSTIHVTKKNLAAVNNN